MNSASPIQKFVIDRLGNVEAGEPTRLAFIDCCKEIAGSHLENIFYRAILDPRFDGDVLYSMFDAAVMRLIEKWRLTFEECGYDAAPVMPTIEKAIIEGAEERFDRLMCRLDEGGCA